MTTMDPNVVDTYLTEGLRERAADLGDEDWFHQQVLATIALRPQRRWFGRRPARFGRRTALLLVAAALVGLLAGTAVVGAFLRQRPAPTVVPAVWTATGRMIEDRALHTATLLPDGRVLVAGGYGLHQESAELYDPASKSWTATGRLTEGRAEQTATLLPDGRVLVAGGIAREGEPDAELYDPDTGSWTAAENITKARHGHTATLLPDGRVLVAGGSDDATAELYDPRSGTWTATENMVRARHYHTATLLPDGMVLVAGDFAGDAFSAELYDPRTGTWTPTGSMIHGRWDFTATLLPDGSVLVAGTESDSTRSAELYDPRTGRWTATGTMIDARHFATATLLPDGTVLVAGGENGMSGIPHEVASAELYDPRSRAWTPTASMEVARRNHTATLLPDGTVLVAGGVVRNGADATAELYGPGTGR
jgi:uncharacterized delta-60 repeat protein